MPAPASAAASSSLAARSSAKRAATATVLTSPRASHPPTTFKPSTSLAPSYATTSTRVGRCDRRQRLCRCRRRPCTRRRPLLNFAPPPRGPVSPRVAPGLETTRSAKRRRMHCPRLPWPSPGAAVPVYEALRAALPRCTQMGIFSWVADTLRYGVQIEWDAAPPHFFSPEHPLSSSDRDFHKLHIQCELDNSYILEVTDPEDVGLLVCVCSAFVVHTAGKPSAVFEYNYPNAYVFTASFMYETLPDLVQSLCPNDTHLSWYMKDAYHHLIIWEHDRKFLAFRCLGRFFLPFTMPFGLASAPQTWTKFMWPVLSYLRSQDIRIIDYVDDFCGAPPAPLGHPATAAQAAAADLLSSVFTASPVSGCTAPRE